MWIMINPSAYLEQNPEEYGVPDTFEGMRQNISFLKDNVCFNVMGFYSLVKKAKANGDLIFREI